MSDEEDIVQSEGEEEEVSEEEEEEETNSEAGETEDEEEEANVEEPKSPTTREPASSGPSEAELAMQRRRAKEQLAASGLDEEAREMLAANQVEREQLANEIDQMRARSERRKKEREEEEKRMAEQRAAEDARRKAEEEERKKKKEEEERERRQMRAEKMAEFEKWKNPPKPNFVIQRKESAEVESQESAESSTTEKKSREQLEAEKKAILSQRIQPLNVDGADMSKLTEKAKELQALVLRLESEKYDLEKRFKNQQLDMMELAERARQMNKVGRGGQIKRLQNEDDKMAERFAGCPSKIVMYSEFERQKDKREYGTRRALYVGPVYGFPAERIQPTRLVKWDETTGLPIYETLDGEPVEAPAAEEE